ncbi:hypothetical protein [Moorena sp. SIO4G3]|nr:hypothetical protein [Moorena sp. SIO4G3]
MGSAILLASIILHFSLFPVPCSRQLPRSLMTFIPGELVCE